MRMGMCIIFLSGMAVATAAAPSKSIEYRALGHTEERWQNSTYWTGADWARVGRDWQHPGTGAPSVRRFVVPEDGKVTITGAIRKLDLSGGDGVKAVIRLDETEVWSADIEARDGKGKDPGLTLDVRRGQVLRFVVDPKASITFDSTTWDPVVSYADGRKHQASTAFGDRQGKEGWHYEMEVRPGAGAASATPVPRSPTAAATALRALAGLDLPAMVEAEWRLEDGIDGNTTDWSTPIARHLDGARRLVSALRRTVPDTLLAEEQARLTLQDEASRDPKQCTENLYLEVRRLKRRVALANPLLRFDQLLFCKRRPAAYSHLVMQYFGWRAQMGGGLLVLEKPGHTLKARDILDGKLAGGSVLCPDLSYDGRQIVFSYVTFTDGKRPASGRPDQADEAYYHLYVVNVDGTGLRQITSGPFDDLMPAWLPDGGIAFSSTRRKGYARCFGGQFGERWHVYTLHRVEADGNDLRTLSYHDTNEWFPTVMNDGRLVYARWDYIDRDAVTHQNLWATRPDGSNPVALWGNAVPKPHCAFEARAVPGSDKLVFTASAHHSSTAGSIVLVDPSVDNNSHAALRRLTPSVPFPEAEGRAREYYCTPWPLSEEYFLVSYSPLHLAMEPSPQADNALGIYLLDAFGNRELIYRDPEIGSTSPIPLRARPRPPVIPRAIAANASVVGTMLMSDVYRGLGNVERGTIKQLRIVQIFPKTTPWANKPPIGVGGEENPRAILGTVPVYEDASAHFEVPAGKPILFQALDKDGFAYQTMRTITYVQPGERVSCVGCHEGRLSTPPTRPTLAAARPPSTVEPGVLGGAPFSYVRFVQPILDRNCVRCHGGKEPGKGKDPGIDEIQTLADDTRGDRRPGNGMDLTSAKSGAFTASYVALTKSAALVPRFPARNQIQITEPGGKNSALGSALIRQLRAGHKGVKLKDDELRTLIAWIDLNAVFYGSCDAADNAREQRGEPIAMPAIQ